MAWQEPKTNWEAADVVSKDDFNRIEGNAKELKTLKADSEVLESHANRKDNPHGVTKAQVGLGNVDNIQQATKTEFNSHANNKSNPHGVTAAQIRAATTSQLGNKIDKPTSATSGNIAVFDGGAGKLKDGGKKVADFPAMNNVSAWVKPGNSIAAENLKEEYSTGNYANYIPLLVFRPGKYRITGELRRESAENPNAVAEIYVSYPYYEGSRNGWIRVLCGSYTTSSTSYVAFSIDMTEPIGYGGVIVLELRAGLAYCRNLRVRYEDGGTVQIAT